VARASVRLLVAVALLVAGSLAALGAGEHSAYGAPDASSRVAPAGDTATRGTVHKTQQEKPRKKKARKHKKKKHKAKHHAVDPKAPCGGERPAKPGGGRYTCTFYDNFDGTALDPAKWTVVASSKTGLTTRANGCYRDDPENVSVSGGTLKLTSTVEPRLFFCSKGLLGIFTRHTSASVVSMDRFSQTYGRFEFRAKFPRTSTPAINSAMWMSPQDPAYGRWPASGEIDIAERFGSAHGDHVYPSLHYAGPNGRVTNTGKNCVVAKADSGYHRYAVQWTKTSIKFYYDGRWCFSGSWSPGSPLTWPQPFDRPFYLVMTQPDGAPSTPVGTHDTLTIDWVRAWR
jgi:beta-glucanase (GH16 family)